jgi:hypothetical protein
MSKEKKEAVKTLKRFIMRELTNIVSSFSTGWDSVQSMDEEVFFYHLGELLEGVLKADQENQEAYKLKLPVPLTISGQSIEDVLLPISDMKKTSPLFWEKLTRTSKTFLETWKKHY